MISVYLLNFTKNHLSTAQPNLSSLTPIDCKMKSPCSTVKPVLEISGKPSVLTSYAATNYAYIAVFNCYYFVTNTVFNGSIVTIYLEEDYLATWKAAIEASTQYVLRAASNYDSTIKDTKYPIKAVNPNHSINYGDQRANPLQPSSGSYGCFVVGVVSKAGSLSGCVSYYAMSYLVFIDFMLKLFNLTTQWGSGGTDLADGLKKAITDPMQYVASVLWYPYSVNDFVNRSFVSSGTYDITVGYDTITLGAVCYPFGQVLNIEFTNVLTMTLPAHPQAASRGSYLNFEPFSRYYLSFYPFCSLAELDSTKIGGMGTVYLVYTVDLRTGKGTMSVCTALNGTTWADWRPKAPIRVFEAQVGVPIPVSTIHTDIQNMSQYITNATIAAGTEFGGFKQAGSRIVDTMSNWIAGGLQKIMGSDPIAQESLEQFKSDLQPITSEDISSIASNSAAMKSTCEMLGSQGTMSTYSRMPVALWGDFYTVANDDNARFGRPLCQSVTLNTLSGYIQCDRPRISAGSMNLIEQVTVEQLMSAGFYLDP